MTSRTESAERALWCRRHVDLCRTSSGMCPN
ncbi:putative leader peptide [Rhodococcus triatomae]